VLLLASLLASAELLRPPDEEEKQEEEVDGKTVETERVRPAIHLSEEATSCDEDISQREREISGERERAQERELKRESSRERERARKYAQIPPKARDLDELCAKSGSEEPSSQQRREERERQQHNVFCITKSPHTIHAHTSTHARTQYEHHRGDVCSRG
jgi:hypothetical protein